MSKTLTFTYKDNEYTLEFTKETVKMMEKRGFRANSFEDTPMTTLPDLFAGAFLAHHRYIKKDIVDEIYQHFTHKSELIGKLAEMYNEPLLGLMEEPEEDEGNIDWTTSF